MNHPGFLSKVLWAATQRIIPIACVDIFALNTNATIENPADTIGLIRRNTPHQGQRWCLLGGRVYYSETIAEAAKRHVQTSLGKASNILFPHDAHPTYIAEYFPKERSGYYVDPRQHSIALTYSLHVFGNFLAQGEAIEFEWFRIDKLPPPSDFGFGHEIVVKICIERLQKIGLITTI